LVIVIAIQAGPFRHNAEACQAGFFPGAHAPIVTGKSILFRNIFTPELLIAGVDGARVVVITVRIPHGRTGTQDATVPGGTRLPIITDPTLVGDRIHTTVEHIAAVFRTDVVIKTIDRTTANAGPVYTLVVFRAQISILTGSLEDFGTTSGYRIAFVFRARVTIIAIQILFVRT
jgi:hypothetical protein